MKLCNRPAVRSRGVVERVHVKAFGVAQPPLADELVGREAAEGLQSARMVVRVDEELEVAPELVVTAVGVAPHGRLLDRPVHPLDLPVIRHDACGAASSDRSLRGTVLW